MQQFVSNQCSRQILPQNLTIKAHLREMRHVISYFCIYTRKHKIGILWISNSLSVKTKISVWKKKNNNKLINENITNSLNKISFNYLISFIEWHATYLFSKINRLFWFRLFCLNFFLMRKHSLYKLNLYWMPKKKNYVDEFLVVA